MPSVLLCTASYDHTLRFWEATSQTCYHTINYAESQINQIAFTHNKRLLAAGGHHQIKLYSVKSSNQTPLCGSLEGHTSNILTMGFQQEDKWLYSGSEDQTIRLWDIRNFACHRKYKCLSSVNSIALHPNQGELISAEENGQLRLWDLTADKCVFKTCPDGRVGLRSVSVSADGKKCICASNNGTIYAYSLNRDEYLTMDLVNTFKAHNTFILKCLISPNAKQLATASADHTIKIWNIEDMNKIYLEKTLTGHKKWVWDISYSTDSFYMVSASSDTTARLWDLSEGKAIREYKGHQKACVCIALNDWSV